MNFQTRFTGRSVLQLLLCVCGVVAMASSVCHAQPLPERAPFKGVVMSTTGRLIGGAQILLRRQNEWGTLAAFWGGVAATDARGTFAFPDAEAGSYYLNIEANGFAAINQPLVIPEREATTNALEFRMAELATLRAKVTDAAGAPLKETTFSLLMRPIAGRTDGAPRMQRTRISAAGEVVFEGLVPGKYDLLGVAPDAGYFESKDFEIAPGAGSAAVNWKLAAGGTLQIGARDAAGKAIGGATITFSRVGDATPDAPRLSPGPEMQIYAVRPTFTTRDGDGIYELTDLAPGRYNVAVNYAGAPDVAAQPVEVAVGTTAKASFVLAPPESVAVSAQISDAKDAPLAGTDVILTLSLLAPADPKAAAITPATTNANPQIVSRQERRARTDAAGAITLYPVAAGTYQLTVRRDLGRAGNAPASTVVTAEAKTGAAAIALKVP